MADFSKVLNAIGYAKSEDEVAGGVANAPKTLSRLEQALAMASWRLSGGFGLYSLITPAR